MKKSILIVDDSKAARQQILDILEKKSLFASYYEAENGIEGFKAMLSKTVDVVICDLEMPQMDGFKFLGMVSTREELHDIPVIMVTGREDQEAKIRSLEQGASDYVTKPFDPEELVARVKVQLKIKTLQDELKKSNEILKEISHTDPLTGLSNRRFLMENLKKEFERARRQKSCLSLIMTDLDHFKNVNDTYGHQRGDDVLVAVAQMLRRDLRSYDLAARYGGEEFALVLPETSLEMTIKLAERLRVQANELRFDNEMQDYHLTMSFGVACFPSGEVKTTDDLIREADSALYRAKKLGRNRVESMK